MFRKRDDKKIRHTTPDHRPMIPEFRMPEDALEEELRELRRRYAEVNIGQYKIRR